MHGGIIRKRTDGVNDFSAVVCNNIINEYFRPRQTAMAYIKTPILARRNRSISICHNYQAIKAVKLVENFAHKQYGTGLMQWQMSNALTK